MQPQRAHLRCACVGTQWGYRRTRPPSLHRQQAGVWCSLAIPETLGEAAPTSPPSSSRGGRRKMRDLPKQRQRPPPPLPHPIGAM